MAGSWSSISHLYKEGLGKVIRIIVELIAATLLTVLCILCWIRVKITALIYCNKNRSLISSGDVLLTLDVDHVSSIINDIILIRGNFSLDAMKELFLSKVINAKSTNNTPLFPKFTKYIDICAGYLMWNEESNFNIDDHIKPYSGQPPNNEEELKQLISELCNRRLPSLKSCWQFIVIPLEYGEIDVPRTCVLFRVSHFITDGIARFRLIIEQMAGNHGAYQQMLQRMQTKFKPKFKNPFLNMLVNLARIAYNIIFEYSVIAKEQDNRVFMKDKSKDCELSDSGYIDWTSGIKMDTIKRIRDVTSTTVNDVLMSCMAGAFRKYFIKHDICASDFLKTSIPVSFHGPDDPVDTTNKISDVLMSMPIGNMDCLQRLKAIKLEMDQQKNSPDIMIRRWCQLHLANVIPYTMTRKAFACVSVNVLFSNMPVPPSKIAFGGNTVDLIIPMHLPTRQTGFGVFIFSYGGDLTVCVTVDKARVSSRDDVRQLLDDFVEEIQQLSDYLVVCSPNKLPSTAFEKKIE